MICNVKDLNDPYNRIYKYLQYVDTDFSPTLSNKTKLDEWTNKILKLANVYIEIEEDVIRGMVVFYTNNSEQKLSYCSLLSVDQECRGLGICSRLCEKFIQKSKEDGMIKATIHTNNQIAMSVYKKYGFIEKSRVKSDSEKVLDRVYFEKIL